MTLETKKELLRYDVYTSSVFCDISTYHLIYYSLLDKYIEAVVDDTFYAKIELKDDEINAKRFISLLEYLVKSIREKFFCTNIRFFEIEEIMSSNIELLDEYFYYKGNFSSMRSNPKLDSILNRLIITNFINNARYIDFIESLLNENHIALKEVSEYSEKEIKKIIELLNDIIFCQRTRKHYSCLFENISKRLEQKLLALKLRRKKIYNDEKSKENFINKFIQDYYKDYVILMNNYNKRKEYLKYFK